MIHRPDIMPIHREILKRAREELCQLTADAFAPERLNPLTEEYKLVNDLIEQIENLLGY